MVRTWTLLAAVTLIAAPLTAQMGPRQGRTLQDRPARMGGVERLLSLQRTLELNDEQVATLESLQETFRQQRDAQRDAVRGLREQARSGDVARNDLREQARAHRASVRETAEAHRAQIQGVLNDDQKAKLAELRQVQTRRGAGVRGGRAIRGQHRGTPGMGRRGTPGMGRRGTPGMGPRGPARPDRFSFRRFPRIGR